MKNKIEEIPPLLVIFILLVTIFGFILFSCSPKIHHTNSITDYQDTIKLDLNYYYRSHQ